MDGQHYCFDSQYDHQRVPFNRRDASKTEDDTGYMEAELTSKDNIAAALGEFISSNSSTFTCGGIIPVYDSASSRAAAIEKASSNIALAWPVVIRWDAASGPGVPVQFPIQDAQQAAHLDNLVQSCDPAGFGRGNQDVMDPEYRTAIKMDTSAFSTNLCPYALGIMDQVTRMLLPNLMEYEKEGMTPRGIVVAELYKLNIYKGPSSFFKSHVDTPRKQTQFGSLVIGLPCRHDGGKLTVKHGEHVVDYDWDAPVAAETIQWAAFYSDCEHKVHKVTDGHRVTLTYNLYSFPRPRNVANHVAKPPAPVHIMNLPLYQKLEEALGKEDFMTKGGALGIYSSYAYPFSPSGHNILAQDKIVLKGSDMALFAVLQHLGLKVSVHAIIPHIGEMDGFSESYSEFYMGSESSDDEDMPEDERDWIRERRLSKNAWRAPLVGTRSAPPGRVVVTEEGCDEGDRKEWIQEYFKPRPDVTWITPPKWSGLGMVHGTYGNQAGIGWIYSYTALVVEIPPATEALRRALSARGTA